MRYVVDRIEDNIVILECLSSKEIIEVDKSILPVEVRDGSIVIFDNGKYVLDKTYGDERRKLMRDKFNKLVGHKHE